MEVFYQKMYKIDKLEARKMLIETYQETGSIKKTARLWNTSRNVVRKWLKRYAEEGENGLKDLSRRPITSPRKVSAFPPLLLDKISSNIAIYFSKEGGNNLPANYSKSNCLFYLFRTF